MRRTSDDASRGTEVLAPCPGRAAGSRCCGEGAAESGNVRFLIAHQLGVIDDLDRRELDGRAAHDLLRRLLRRDEALRCRHLDQDPLRPGRRGAAAPV